MRNSYRIATGIGTALALGIALPAATATASTQVKAAPVAATVQTHVQRAAAPNAPAVSGTWYLDAATGGKGQCYKASVSIKSLGACANVDESFYNNTNAPVRLYYSASFGGPWFCVDPGNAFPNLSGYLFNSGSPANKYPVWRDVASVGVGTAGTLCSNPG